MIDLAPASSLRGLRACVIGADGAIGAALRSSLARAGAEVSASTRRTPAPADGYFHLDLERLNAWTPPPCDLCFLAAAMTNLAACRAEPQRARAINVEGPVRIAEKVAAAGGLAVLFSTNQVFSGAAPVQFPGDAPAPQSTYGALKGRRLRRLFGAWRRRRGRAA